jgi:Na+/melibiose symporter-like transporter
MNAITSGRNLAALTAVAAPIAALSLSLTTIIPQELTRNHGVSLAEAGLAFMLIRLADIFIDPFLGDLMDRTRSRMGRYQIWIVTGCVPLACGVWMCFYPPATVSMIYLVVALALAYLGYSILALAHLALCAAQTDDYAERGRVFGWWQRYTTAGILLTMLIPKLLDGNLGLGLIQWMGVTILALLTLSVMATVLLARTRPARASGTKGGLRAYLALFALPATRRVILAELLLGLSVGIGAVTGIMFATSVKGFTIGDFGTQIVVYFLVGVLTATLWGRIAERFEKHRALIFGALGASVGQTLFLFVPPGNVPMLMVPAAIGGFFYGATYMLPRAMIADAADEERLVRGADRTALLYALLTGVFKLGHALSVGIGLLALAAFSYVPALAERNTPAALTGLTFVYIGLPMLCSLGSMLAMFGYPLTRQRHQEIRAVLAGRDDAQANTGNFEEAGAVA